MRSLEELALKETVTEMKQGRDDPSQHYSGNHGFLLLCHTHSVEFAHSQGPFEGWERNIRTGGKQRFVRCGNDSMHQLYAVIAGEGVGGGTNVSEARPPPNCLIVQNTTGVAILAA